MANFEDLVLYYRPTCPYCIKVLTFMKNNDITCEQRDITNPGVRDELVALGGKGQVPCLIIDGVAMYESDDIIDYLRDRIHA